MLSQLFYWLLSMSVNGAAAGVLVLLLCRIKALPRRLTLALWIIPLLRLLVPFSVSGKFGLLALLPDNAVKTVMISEKYMPITVSNDFQTAETYSPLTFKTDGLASLYQAGALLWLVGAASILITLAILYHSTKRELADAVHIEGRLYTSRKITGPAVYGIFRPRILLPEGWQSRDQRELDLILAHEESHLRHLDNLWRLLALAAAAVHWFNPLIWLLLKGFLAELELACDERVLARRGEKAKKDYALALVSCAGEKDLFASGFLSSGAALRTRIDHILSFRTMTILSAVFSCLLFLAVGYSLLTNGAC